MIDGYVLAVGERLRSGAMFKFQVQGCAASGRLGHRSDTWLGVGVSEPEAAAMAARNGFQLVRSEGAGTQYYWLWYLKH